MPQRPWKRIVLVSLLISSVMLGITAAWTWLRAQGSFPVDMRTAPIATMSQPEPADQAPRHEVIRALTAIAGTPDAVARAHRDEVPSVPAPATYGAAESAFAKARQAEADGRWEQAIDQYRQAIALNPMLLEARNNLGNLFIHRRQIAAAIEAFQAALSINSNYALVRNNLGSAYLLTGEEGLAIQEFLAALHIDGAYVSPYYNLALLYARRGDVGQSMAFFTRALALDPAVLSWVQDDPDFDGVRRTPEFQRLRTQKQAKR
jgi:tetratricopeptide (TPR) repeat protein